MVRRNALSKRQEDRGGHIPGRWKSLRVIPPLHGRCFNLHPGRNEVAPGGRDLTDQIDGFSLRANASSSSSFGQLTSARAKVSRKEKFLHPKLIVKSYIIVLKPFLQDFQL